MRSILRNLFGKARKVPQVATLFYGVPQPRPVEEAASDFIKKYEGGFQDDPDDSGNWVEGKLIGTNRGVTPRTLANYRDIPVMDVTREMIRGVTHEEATQIAVDRYYRLPGLDELPWVPLTEAMIDSAYLSGPGTSIRAVQGLIGVAQDGSVGPLTVRAFTDFWREKGPKEALDLFRRWRHRRFDRLGRIYPRKKKNVKGWKRRADGFTAGNREWLAKWA